MNESLPTRWPWLVRGFTRYVRGYLRRNFHAVRLSRQGRAPEVGPGPLLIVLNHPSWWDPLVAAHLAGLFPERIHYAPIDARALSKYRFFEKLGFFGVEQGTRKGALEFLRRGSAILAQPGTALWITAQGQFTDPRIRPVRLRPGVGHLVRRLRSGVVVPLALEYPFWQERYPEALARFGEPISLARGSNWSIEQWVQEIAVHLERTQDALAVEAQRQDSASFEVLLGGSVGVGGIYDGWRRLKAWWQGERFHTGHGAEESTTPTSHRPLVEQPGGAS
jgi:1-acyl-sn-glycerol-3-phosphate acyltransferase